jgi:acetolactate decarboxylase
MKKIIPLGVATLVCACAAVAVPALKEGLVEFYGAQKNIFETGRADPLVPVAAMSGHAGAYGVGALAGLDGEITVYEGKPYVTKVRGSGYALSITSDDAAVFAVWTKSNKWTEEPVPPSVHGYQDLQTFVKTRAAAAGIDVSKPFPFLMSGTPLEVKWHINVDLTEGRSIDPQLFAKSKANYIAKNEPMNIVGFYSENHAGVFISAFAPAIKDKTARNAIHIHMVTKDGKSAGHIDDFQFGADMKLRLPASDG